MITVNMPDGASLQFPDDTPQDKIKATSQQYMQKQQGSKSTFDTVKDALSSREAFQMYGSAAGGLVGAPTGPVGVATGAGLGAGAGGQLHDLFYGNAGTGGEQAVKAAKDIAIEGTTALVAPKVMQAGVDVAQKALSPAVKTLASNIPMVGKYGKVGAKNIDDLRTLESAGMKYDASLLDDPTLQGLGTSLRAKAGSNKIMQDVDRFNYQRASELAEETAESLGSARTASDAGEALKASASTNKSKFFDVADKLYSKVDDFIPERIGVPTLRDFASKNKQELLETATEAAENPEAIKTLQNILKDVGEYGVVDSKKIASFRRLSKNAYDRSPKDRTNTDKVLIKMREALDQDLDNAVMDFGGKEGKKALKNANKWWKKGVGDEKRGKVGMLKTYDDILKKEESSDVASDATMKALSVRGGGDKLKRILKANPEAAGDVKAYIFRQMGGGQKGFSYQKFLTSVDNMHPDVKKLIFKNSGDSLKKLQRVSQMVASLEKRGNFSNTENTRLWNELWEPIKKGIMIGGLSGGAIDPASAVKGALVGGGVIGAGVTSNIGAAKLMTSPKFVKWLADTSERVLIKPDQLPAQVGRLALMATKMPQQEGEAIIDYISQLGFDTKKIYNKDGNLKNVEVQ